MYFTFIFYIVKIYWKLPYCQKVLHALVKNIKMTSQYRIQV